MSPQHQPPTPQLPPDHIRAALTATKKLGPFFTVHTSSHTPNWTLTNLPPEELHTRITATGTALNTIEIRVAAATWHLSLVAKIWSSTIGTYATSNLLINPATLILTPTGSDLSYHPNTPPAAQYAPNDPKHPDLTHWLREVMSTFSAIHHALTSQHTIANGLLWGNVGSAIVTTSRLVAQQLPSFPAATFCHLALTQPELTNTMQCHPNGRWQRKSCCLYYRVPGGGKCGDCSLLH